MKKLIALSSAAMILVSGAVFAEEAQSQKQAANAADFRQALLQVVRSNMGDIGAMARGKRDFDAAIMEKNGMRLEQLGMMMEDYFRLDTRKFDLETDALDKIWDNKEDFNSKINDLIVAAQNLQAVAKSGDQSKFAQAIGGVGRTCKGCHDEYKAE